MKSFGLRNVKAFENTGCVDIAPITIFVGKNSCGKSSFIRFPVVLKQTFRSGSDSPISLHGQQENYIDYGNFENVLHNKEDGSFSVELEYPIDVNNIPNEVFLRSRRNVLFEKRLNLQKDIARIIITFSKPTMESRVFATKVELFINGLLFSRFVKDGNKKVYDYSQQKTIVEGGKMISVDYAFRMRAVSIRNYMPEFDDEAITVSLCEKHGIIEEEQQKQIYKKVIFPIKRNALLASLVETNVETLKKEEGQLSDTEKEIQNECMAFEVSAAIFRQLYLRISEEFNNLHYIGPFRAEPKRVYRREEIDHFDVGNRGDYTSSLLINDSHEKRLMIDNVSEWFYRAMKYKIGIKEVDKSSSLYQLVATDETKQETNIMDVGYGISQALPIVTQIAMVSQKSDNLSERSKKTRAYPEIIVVEQPELHLHPAAQSELASLFVTAVKHSAGMDRKMLIETHSEHFIRALQVMIADPDESITKEMVKVYYVDKNQDGDSSIKEMKINEFGQFEEPWPSGFFDRAYDLSMELLEAGARRKSSNKEGE